MLSGCHPGSLDDRNFRNGDGKERGSSQDDEVGWKRLLDSLPASSRRMAVALTRIVLLGPDAEWSCPPQHNGGLVYEAILHDEISPEFLLTACLASSRPVLLALRVLRTYQACGAARPESAVFWEEKQAVFERFIEGLFDMCSSDDEAAALLLLRQGTVVLDLACDCDCAALLSHWRVQAQVTTLLHNGLPGQESTLTPYSKAGLDMTSNLGFLALLAFVSCNGERTFHSQSFTSSHSTLIYRCLDGLVLFMALARITRDSLNSLVSGKWTPVRLAHMAWFVSIVAMRALPGVDVITLDAAYGIGCVIVATVVLPQCGVMDPVIGPLILIGKLHTIRSLPLIHVLILGPQPIFRRRPRLGVVVGDVLRPLQAKAC